MKDIISWDLNFDEIERGASKKEEEFTGSDLGGI